MTTYDTCFFRDKIPFDHFRTAIIPEVMRARASRRGIRIWSAGSSTGQEPYSIAMCLREMGAMLNGWRIDFLATDLSSEAIEKSKAGLYSQFEVQRGLPIQLLVKYFQQTGELWQINADVRGMIAHHQLDLRHDFSQLGGFDIIFCRNVLTSFDPGAKINLFHRLAEVTETDGFLVLGTAETTVGLTDAYRPHPERRGLYRPSAFQESGPPKVTTAAAAAAKAAALMASR